MDIISAAYLISNADYKACPKPDRPEYAFIGRSNVGKSSLINMLCNNSKLAKTSAAPGKTQLINHFSIQSNNGKKTAEQWYLVDLPGYGFAKVSQTSRRRWEQMIENYLRKRENLVNVFVLIDSRHSPQKIDLAFISQLDKWEIPFSLVFTKTDKEKPAVIERNIKAFFETLSETWQFLPRHFITSAEKKQGREALLDFIGEQNQLVA
ncbi:MAG: YihA family ribosome biogenesis GTP-binding protein [Sediminibacterium sp.]|nr:YihA family ribosome biogenesis GTP-binding protein [Sediminibacterium sp.]MBX9779451.1 ribosome biogenesis GTP-binding protein YihA/YsxC [Chitinophagaceae bacterium]